MGDAPPPPFPHIIQNLFKSFNLKTMNPILQFYRMSCSFCIKSLHKFTGKSKKCQQYLYKPSENNELVHIFLATPAKNPGSFPDQIPILTNNVIKKLMKDKGRPFFFYGLSLISNVGNHDTLPCDLWYAPVAMSS